MYIIYTYIIIHILYYLQTDGTVQEPHMSCSYADLALSTFDNRALASNRSPTTGKMFWDDVFVVWTHGSADLDLLPQ